jgi:hypothetical protein
MSTVRMLMIAATTLLLSGVTGASAQAVSPCHTQIVADIDTTLMKQRPELRPSFNKNQWVAMLDSELNQMIAKHATVNDFADGFREWPALLSDPADAAHIWACVTDALNNNTPAPRAPAEKPDNKKACSDPPAFSLKTTVDDGLDAAGAPAMQGVSYCMAYASSDSAYPLDCALRGRHATLYPREKNHLIEGWPIGTGELCEAHVVCVKETRFPNLLAEYCPNQ